ncbi:hypothetical protein DL98DRAFT_97187 [Cadophora sp. DSE1049]|nr:hypothetical protein DL98DRAFT_97187 [Cadophora sp. DSE1049]
MEIIVFVSLHSALFCSQSSPFHPIPFHLPSHISTFTSTPSPYNLTSHSRTLSGRSPPITPTLFLTRSPPITPCLAPVP